MYEPTKKTNTPRHRRGRAVETQWYRIDRRRIAVQAPPITIAFALRSLCTPDVILRLYCAATATSRDPTTLLSERQATAFVLSMLKVRAVARRSMRSHRVHWLCHLLGPRTIAFYQKTRPQLQFRQKPKCMCHAVQFLFMVVVVIHGLFALLWTM